MIGTENRPRTSRHFGLGDGDGEDHTSPSDGANGSGDDSAGGDDENSSVTSSDGKKTEGCDVTELNRVFCDTLMKDPSPDPEDLGFDVGGGVVRTARPESHFMCDGGVVRPLFLLNRVVVRWNKMSGAESLGLRTLMYMPDRMIARPGKLYIKKDNVLSTAGMNLNASGHSVPLIGDTRYGQDILVVRHPYKNNPMQIDNFVEKALMWSEDDSMSEVSGQSWSAVRD